MPCDRVACPLCAKMVSRLNLGAHFLSRTHIHDFLNDKAINQTLQAFYKSKVVRNEEFKNLPTFSVKNESFNLCLGCKRCYTAESMRKEKSNHFENHPECCEPFKAALTTLVGPKEVGMTEPDALQKENDALKREIERLKKQPVIPTPANIGMTGDVVPKEEYDRLDEENDETQATNMCLRGILKDIFGERFPTRVSGKEEIEILKDLAKNLNAPAPAPEPPKPEPKSVMYNEAKVQAYLEAHIAQDLDEQQRLDKSMNFYDRREVHLRVNAYEASRTKAPVPAPVAPAPAAPAHSSAFQPPPLNPPVLGSTLRRGKMTDRERVALSSR